MTEEQINELKEEIKRLEKMIDALEKELKEHSHPRDIPFSERIM